MDIGSSLASFFNLGQPQGSAPANPGQPQSSFFDNLLSGAGRGVAQTFSTSSIGQSLSGFLAQGQSQVAAQNLFGNPLLLIGGVALAGLGIFFLLRK